MRINIFLRDCAVQAAVAACKGRPAGPLAARIAAPPHRLPHGRPWGTGTPCCSVPGHRWTGARIAFQSWDLGSLRCSQLPRPGMKAGCSATGHQCLGAQHASSVHERGGPLTLSASLWHSV
eukprot:scaffold137802_cov22-Tisochrysis_lutea.AAC.1